MDGYLVEYYTSNPVYEVQVITTSSGPSLSAVQRITVDSDANNLAGYFRLEFQGATTANIRYDANPEGEDSLAQALVRLPTMGAVAVSRADSRRAVPSLLVNGTAGASFVTVSNGGAASVKTLNAGDVIWIGTSNVPLTISAITTTAATGVIQISFAPSTLSFVASFTAAQVFKWSYGFTWDVTFLTQIGPQPLFVATTSDNWAGTNPVLKVDGVRAGVSPLSGTFRVGYQGSMTPPLEHDLTAVDMKAALEELDTIREVAVTRQRNAFGYDWRVTFFSELGNVPSLYVNDAGLAGPFAKGEISNMFNGRLPVAYHSVFVPGGTATSTVITGLTQGLGYQVLVSAHNVRGYGYQLVAFPALVTPQQAPSPPFNASFYALSPSALKLAWATPLDLGGPPIQMYRVEWDIVATFQNVGVSGNVREMIVDVLPLNASSTYCIDIAINPASASIARYARVYAFNGYAWSQVGFPTPRSTIAQILAPGAPLHVVATATSATGIQVTWGPPAADDCVYGGDGGSPVTQYVIEWDTRPDFASPAAQAATDNTVAPLAYQIGGRDVLTGVISTVLESNTLYYVRVTAFNGQGAGVAGNAVAPVTTTDQLPSPPTAVTVTTAGVTSLGVVWDLPISDGGATIEKYRLEYGTTDNNFTYYQAVDLPIVHEVQAVVAQSNVAVEVQAIRALVEVTNERQTVRSQVNGIDEVQTVTTTCDDVTNEVQRVTTSAIDINEVQTLEPVGTDVNEVQLIRTRSLDVPTVQVAHVVLPIHPFNTSFKSSLRSQPTLSTFFFNPLLNSLSINQVLDISTARVKGQQVIGVIISGIDTSACSGDISTGTNVNCFAVESLITGSFKLSFDPNACGTDPAVPDSNWCGPRSPVDSAPHKPYDTSPPLITYQHTLTYHITQTINVSSLPTYHY